MSDLEKVLTVFVGGLVAAAVLYTITAKTARTPAVITSLGKATSSSLSAAEGRST